MAAWCHDETYRRPSGEQIDEQFRDREVKGWARYQGLHEGFLARMAELDVDSLAKFYTSDLKYAPKRFQADSEKLRLLFEERGFLP
jgi:hypothetical protein